MKKLASFLAASGFLLVSCSHPQTSRPGERLAWQNETLTKAYETVGNRNPKWDEAATNALATYARVRAGEDDVASGVGLVGEYAEHAVNAGCDDPMIRYLYCRFGPAHASKPLGYWQNECMKNAQSMESSGYASLLKFYANDRTANILWQGRDTNHWAEVDDFRRAAMSDFCVALQDKSLPIEEVAEGCDALIDTISDYPQQMTDVYAQIEPVLFKNWPNTAVAYFIKGRFYLQFAWQARGGGYANNVTPEGWKGFKEKLAVADSAFRKAWSLNPKDERIPTQMIEMAVCLQKDRSEMELWFKRGMELNTNNYEVCAEKLRYLLPQWYGARDGSDMVAFGRECVASNWGGRVPLILADAHYRYAEYLERKQQDEYWRQPDVWTDMQAAYEKFFQLNPDATDTRYNYAYYAFRCGQWADFNQQIKLIRDQNGKINTDYFGGDAAFDKMMAQANPDGAKAQN